ncbi:hypothetical protein DFJ58DRAFT_843501 [Suillus subalutaceus]|uniref:uncharacterized protein n=1 Tax=Suillus subalutaceus TaxID=48586 RepID=UPI001B871A06|nr:uncharacterized protein DFJ58DRAFT_843501 [Suillus subalutaceus]KAG1846425.1 hypothetical protein DFJ58DRAFT_843501 [Suillus subalutaceus]
MSSTPLLLPYRHVPLPIPRNNSNTQWPSAYVRILGVESDTIYSPLNDSWRSPRIQVVLEDREMRERFSVSFGDPKCPVVAGDITNIMDDADADALEPSIDSDGLGLLFRLSAYISGQQHFLADVHHDDVPPARFQEDAARPRKEGTHVVDSAIWMQRATGQGSCVFIPIIIKRKMEFSDLAIPRKQRILESFPEDGMRHLLAMPMKLIHCNMDLSPTAKRLYREVHKADTQLCPFMIKRAKSHEPSNARTSILSLPVEILIIIASPLGVGDLHSLTQVSSVLREIAGPLFFAIRNFPTSPQDMFNLHDRYFSSTTHDAVLDEVDVRPAQLSAFSHFLQSIPRKSLRYITLFWSFNILASPVFPQIIAFLENICASGCEELTCMGFSDYMCSPSVFGLAKIKVHPGLNRLKCFEASSWVFFSPELLPFTMQTIHSSSLEKLRLGRVGLSSAQWDKLLRHLSNYGSMLIVHRPR